MNFEKTYMETANEKKILFINLRIINQDYTKVISMIKITNKKTIS